MAYVLGTILVTVVQIAGEKNCSICHGTYAPDPNRASKVPPSLSFLIIQGERRQWLHGLLLRGRANTFVKHSLLCVVISSTRVQRAGCCL